MKDAQNKTPAQIEPRLERGCAEILISLGYATIKITREDGTILALRENVPEGTWNRLWDFLTNELEIKPV